VRHLPGVCAVKNRIIQGDALEVLRTMPDESVHCSVTSPPYWGLRDYGVPGQLGLERTPEEYTAKMVEIFREVRRVLKKDGTLWLNLGDCYATGAGKVGDCPGGGEQGERWKGYRGTRAESGKHVPHSMSMGPMIQPNRMPLPGLKPKDLVGIPWRIAFALQADGWWLRSDIIWAKPNPMPESVTDRPTKAHEYLFLMSKAERYYYDATEMREESITDDARKPYAPGQVDNRGNGHSRGGGKERNATVVPIGRRNKRTVWTVTTEPFPEAHFATFPKALIEPCIKAGCPPAGTVLDPFMGSGTTAVVARKLNRNYIGIELNEKYIEIAERRIEREVGLLLEVP